MFKCLTQIKSVFRFFPVGNIVITTDKHLDKTGTISIFNLLDINKVISVQAKKYISSIHSNDQMILAVDLDDNGIIYNHHLEIIDEIPRTFSVTTDQKINDLLVVYKGGLMNREFGVYSLANKKLIWIDTEHNGLEFCGEYLFGQSSYEFFRTNPITGNNLWRIDLKCQFPELTGLHGRIIIKGCHDKLVLLCLEKIDQLIALDLDTGELVWSKETLPEFYQLDDQGDALYVITQAYNKVDPKTGDIIDRFVDQDYLNMIGIVSQRNNYVIVGDHIITTDSLKGIIGAFNTVTHQYDWVHREEGVSFPGASPIRYSEPYLFVHDNRGSLHIFENEG